MDNPTARIPPEAIAKSYHDRRLDKLSDAALFASVANVLHHPKRAINSFALHAPLELLARFLLLNTLPVTAREPARLQMVAVGACYESIEGDVGPPIGIPSPGSVDEAARKLSRSIEAGDVDAADALGAWLGDHASPVEFVSLGTSLFLDFVGAAAHGPIYLALLAMAPPAIKREAIRMARIYTRQLAKESERRIRTGAIPEADTDDSSADDVEGLFWRAMAAKFDVAPPTGPGVWNIIETAETSRVVAKAMASAWPKARRNNWQAALRGICTGAAYAMLQDRRRDAKYGWSHCLTIPHGLSLIAPFTFDKLGVVRLASIIGVGFRHASGDRPLSRDLDLPHTRAPLSVALLEAPPQAASAAFRGAREDEWSTRTLIAQEASARNDAHLVKYTLTCFDLAATTPSSAPLYYAAAAYLLAIWMAETPAGGDGERLTEGRL